MTDARESRHLAILLAMTMFVLVVDTSLVKVSIASVVEDLDTTVSGVQSAIALEALALPRTATATTATGGSCSLSSTFNALVPGSVQESKRAIWELGQVQVYDAGDDGSVSTTADNSVFERQGIFVP
jgi:hypothetical protein